MRSSAPWLNYDLRLGGIPQAVAGSGHPLGGIPLYPYDCILSYAPFAGLTLLFFTLTDANEWSILVDILNAS